MHMFYLYLWFVIAKASKKHACSWSSIFFSFSYFSFLGLKKLEVVESAEHDVQNEIRDNDNEDTQAHEHSDEEMDSDEEHER